MVFSVRDGGCRFRRPPVARTAFLFPSVTLYLALALLLLLFTPASKAHFKLNLNIRVIHVEHVQDGLDVYFRLPMPYLVANKVGDQQADGTRTPAPFTSNAMVNDELMHFLDISALHDNALSLGQLVADGHIISSADKPILPAVFATRVYEGKTQPPFSTLEEAKRAFADTYKLPQGNPPPFVGDTVVDTLVQYRTGEFVDRYSIRSSLDPGLPGQEDTANLILDYTDTDQRIYRETGLLKEPLMVSRSWWNAAKTFIYEGIRHILGGHDHLLFVACLVIGAATLVSLAWRVTGFTLGHSITLSLGFFGFVPSAQWFIPLVKSGIALSIIYAAVLALSTTDKTDTKSSLIITTLIGLLHGLGFGFVLQEILGLSSANIWVSLLAFNIGVEIGQLAVVVLLWPLFALLRKYNRDWHHYAKWVIAIIAIAIASVWTGQRLTTLLSMA